MKKRLFSAVLALAVTAGVTLSLAACGGGGGTYESEPETRRTATTDAAPTTEPPASAAEPPAPTAEPPKADLSRLPENPETDFEFKLNSEIDGIEITKYIGTETKVRIPETIYEKPVKIIAARVFSYKAIEQVYIPDTVTEIADELFWWCASLTDVRLPDGLTSIGNEAFCGCKSLTNITIPDKVTSIGNG
ncbi:MAG: leucine-rich repeat domain-containing protein, partial [Oscillospiraceae bacterium]|nr:leucine-rich repeat domain-containing protein [Oscillospiraceae bacterium]